MAATPSPAQKIEELESIRGIAALLVVIYHIPKWNPLLNTSFINNGYLMVELFFVLSGYVIFSAYAQKIRTWPELLRFQFLRLGRLYPVHLTFLLAFLFIEIAKYLTHVKLGINSINGAPFQENSLGAFIRNLLLVESIFPGTRPTFNYPAWSICVEFYTYLVFGLVVLCLHKFKTLVFALLSLSALALLVTESTQGFDSLLRCLAGFFIGCLTAQAISRLKATVQLPRLIPLLATGLLLLFLLFKTSKAWDPLIYALSALLITALVLTPDSAVNRVLRLKGLTWLGALSYSVYMSHAAIVWTINQVFRVVFKMPEIVAAGGDGKSTPQISGLTTLAACAVIVLAVLLVSAVVHHVLEKPLRERSRRLVFKGALQPQG